jgi:ABC-type branched-subunit amino acid transport system ATPase component
VIDGDILGNTGVWQVQVFDHAGIEGETILVIDKNLKEMARVVDRHHIIEKGRQVWDGTPVELAAQPELSQRYLGV